jgi:hypothetical protein
MIKKVKRLAAAASIAAVAAVVAFTGATAGVASARVLGSSGIEPGLSPVAWNGTDLVTAAVGANGTLYAYEQVPGASSWQRQAIETQAGNGGAALGTPSVTATATAPSSGRRKPCPALPTPSSCPPTPRSPGLATTCSSPPSSN